MLQNTSMSKKTPHLIKRGETWYARLVIPTELRSRLGHKREFIQSLRTKDLTTATIKSAALVAEWKNAIHVARGNPSAIQTKAIQLRNDSNAQRNSPNGMADISSGFTYADAEAEYLADKLDGTRDQELFYDYFTGRIGTPFSHYVNTFTDQNYQNPRTIKDVARAIKVFEAHCPTLEEVDKRAVHNWIEKETRARSTVTKNKSFLSLYWQFLQQRSVVKSGGDPFLEVKIPKNLRKRETRDRFSDQEVKQILAAVKHKKDDALHHLILLAMYTGARISELTGLRTSDIQMVNNVLCFTIKESKTKSGIRNVPVHKSLSNLVQELVSDSRDGFLLSNIKTKGDLDRRADVLGKRFGRIARSTCSLPKSKVFHSFRNTVATKLESFGVPENIAADILGHKKTTMTYGLYSRGTSELQRMEAINTISYDV